MHFYNIHNGDPVWEVPNASKPGKTRRPTVRDVRKGDLAVGVTSVIGFQSAPALENWKVKTAVQRALEGAWSDDPEVALAEVLQAGRDELEAATEAGSNMHDELEQYLRGAPCEAEWVQGAIDALDDLVNLERDYEVEKPFAHALGFGGRIDFISNDWVVDFKTKEWEPGKEPRVYSNHRLQLVAYDLGERMNQLKETFPGLSPRHDIWRQHANIFINRHPDHYGDVHVVVHKTTDNERWLDWLHFYHMLRAFQAAKRIPFTGRPIEPDIWGEAA